MFRQEADLCAVNILTPWEDATEQILNSNETPVVCIVGSKNMGKSTLSRYVVNSLLNKYQSVAFLECDVGQSEFTPAGLLSLNIVTTPLLGPPFTHMQPPYHSLLIGATSPKDDPDYYLACLRQLCSTYRTELSCGPQGAPVPLVINTHGWVKGMGLDLLIHLLRLANPTDILQLAVPEFAPQSSYKNIPVDLLSTLTPSGTELPRVALLPTNVNDTIREKFRAHDLRALQATAYFYQTASATGMMTPRWQFHIPLTARVPFQVPFGQVRIRFMHLEVPVDQTLYALNGTMVALVIDRSIPTEVSPQPASSLRVIPWNTPLSAEAHHCVGLGIIRGVDLSSEMFHVLTGPIPKDLLQRVNTFVRAPALDLPAPFFTHGYDATRAHLPYTTKLPLEGVGSVAWKTRRNLLRRRPTKE
ncbi:Pre-mRNA cleavage complex II protein Clp1-domain-containing protein [Gaertneriomyces semiglobifer]|nr:Pre-mRNA cleavage complex II protein Clp1-domain-containing protein [Gaertneriomyces semiglobifer]